jgi:hypothetical protein
MAAPPHRRERFLDHGRVFIETPLLMTGDELADVLTAFVAEVRARQPEAPAPHPEERSQQDSQAAVTSHLTALDHAVAAAGLRRLN